MLLAPAVTTAPKPLLIGTPADSLVRLHYVIRAPQTGTRAADIDAYVPAGASTTRVEGTFEQAVAAAQRIAGAAVLDTNHRLPINPAQAVLDAGDGAWLIATVVGDHRESVGPVFIDGDFFRRSGLAVWAERLSGGSALAALVGVDNLVDLRNNRRQNGLWPIRPA